MQSSSTLACTPCPVTDDYAVVARSDFIVLIVRSALASRSLLLATDLAGDLRLALSALTSRSIDAPVKTMPLPPLGSELLTDSVLSSRSSSITAEDVPPVLEDTSASAVASLSMLGATTVSRQLIAELCRAPLWHPSVLARPGGYSEAFQHKYTYLCAACCLHDA